MVRRETAGRQETSGGIFRERDGLFRSPEQSGGSERYQVSGVNDPAEVRAERTADAVMGGGVFREADSHASGDGIFHQAEGPGPEGGPAELSSADLSEPGDTLPGDLQQSMGESMGADFSDVRVHTGLGADRASRQISARAFTRGRDVYFRSGTYDPGSREGRHLIAHELAHVAGGDNGLHRVVDVRTADPAALAPEKAQEVKDFVTAQKTALQETMTTNKLDDMRKKYVTGETVIVDSEIAEDKAKITAMKNAVTDATTLVDKLKEGVATDNVKDEIKSAYEEGETGLRASIDAVKDDVEKMSEKVEAENTASISAPLSDTVKDMVTDPAFAEFKKAVSKLSTAKSAMDADNAGRFDAANEAAVKKAKEDADKDQGKTAQPSLEEKQQAVGLQAEKGGDGLSKAAAGFHAVGGATGEVSESAGGVASAVTSHVEGNKIEKQKLTGEEKEKAEEKAEKKASDRSEAVGGIVGGVGETLSGVGGTLDTISNSKEAAAQRNQDMQAKKSMQSIAAQLERTVPSANWGTPRGQRIKAVCDRVKQSKFSTKDNTMSDLISAAMDKKDTAVTPDLLPKQEELLSSLMILETSRACSKENAKNMRKEAIFSSMDAFGSFLRGAGSLTSSIGSLVDSSIAGIVGSVLSLVGAIFGQIGAIRAAMSPEEGEGGADGEGEQKMEASREAIRQMAGLTAVDDSTWTNLTDKANGKPGSGPVSREKMFAAERYAGVFFSIQAANVNMADILYAVEKGEFGKDLGNNQKKTAEDSMRDMYANLSMS